MSTKTIDITGGESVYCFNEGQLRNAYKLVMDTPGGISEDDAYWARFQHANALMHIDKKADALKEYDQIAASSSPWARDASLEAGYIRLDERYRHEPVTPVQTSAG